MKTLFCFLSFLCIQVSLGQSIRDVERSKKELNHTLNNQFNTILEQGSNYVTDSIPFEVIKTRYLIAFKQHLADSLTQYNQTINLLEEQQLATEQKNKELTVKLNELQQKDTNVLVDINTVSLLGIKVPTSTFIWVFWILVIISIGSIGFLGKEYFGATAFQKLLIKDKEVAENQLNDFVKKSLAREQKLSRKIMDLEKLTKKPKREPKKSS